MVQLSASGFGVKGVREPIKGDAVISIIFIPQSNTWRLIRMQGWVAVFSIYRHCMKLNLPKGREPQNRQRTPGREHSLTVLLKTLTGQACIIFSFARPQIPSASPARQQSLRPSSG